jgi:formamidopyrimidine-DNA glycosylase
MTGHLLYGKYHFNAVLGGIKRGTSKNGVNQKDPWQPISPEPLKDPYNRHVHFVISFSNGHQLALSDVRKFAKVALINGEIISGELTSAASRNGTNMTNIHKSSHLKDLGPEPLDRDFTFEKFAERLDIRPRTKIKQVLMDQNIIAGIGNIYADESLWSAGIHPAQIVNKITAAKQKLLFHAIKRLLTKGVNFGGDSMSDYRNVHGEKGKFQLEHHAYQKTGTKCSKPGCSGTIVRTVLGGRGTHYCNRHQVSLGGVTRA